jgi:hypothetical protein
MTRPEYTDPQIVPHESAAERESRERLTKLLATTPIPAEYLIDNLAVYLRRCQLSDLLAMDALYRRLRAVPGVIMEFGVLHGRHLAALTALRGFYEPQNSVRRITGSPARRAPRARTRGTPRARTAELRRPGGRARSGSGPAMGGIRR